MTAPYTYGWDPTSIQAFPPLTASGGGAVVLTATGVEPGSFQRNPLLVSTNSLAPVLFWTAPFTLTADGPVAIDFRTIAFMVNANGTATTMGALYTADVDGVPLPDAAVAELSIDAGAGLGVQTWTTLAAFLSESAPLLAGPHVLRIFLSVFDVNCTAQTAAGEASLRIGRV